VSWHEGFAGQGVLVTGASSGIGRATALAFGRSGARVALVSRRKQMLEAVAGEIAGMGGEAFVAPVDVTRPEAVRACLELVRERLGRIDVVVNNAGVLIPSRVLELSPADLDAMLRVNVFGALAVMQEAVRIMLGQGGGCIVNVASLAGRRGMTPLGGYCATKFALVGVTEALRTELHGSPVHVALVMPGVVDTPMLTDAGGRQPIAGIWPPALNMPPSWVVWAIFAAARFRLIEISVPPGAAALEKLASLIPGVADSVIHWGAQATQWLARLLDDGGDPRTGPSPPGRAG
jgi:NAD(P)-dependent dehydrogenase (short-subunit alcohol dehydrogenase family)